MLFPQRFGLAGAGFGIYELDGPATAGVFGAEGGAVMLLDAAGEVGGDAGVEGVVAAEEEVEVIHENKNILYFFSLFSLPLYIIK